MVIQRESYSDIRHKIVKDDYVLDPNVQLIQDNDEV